MSHDEVVHGKGSLLDQMRRSVAKVCELAAPVRLHVVAPWQETLVHGCEFGQWKEWNHDESLQWDCCSWQSHQGVQRYLADSTRCTSASRRYTEVDFESAGFEWIDCHNWQDSILVFVARRRTRKTT